VTPVGGAPEPLSLFRVDSIGSDGPVHGVELFVTDRLALGVIEAAEQSGQLKPGQNRHRGSKRRRWHRIRDEVRPEGRPIGGDNGGASNDISSCGIGTAARALQVNELAGAFAGPMSGQRQLVGHQQTTPGRCLSCAPWPEAAIPAYLADGPTAPKGYSLEVAMSITREPPDRERLR
jgi:hypothetical protein